MNESVVTAPNNLYSDFLNKVLLHYETTLSNINAKRCFKLKVLSNNKVNY